MLVYCSIRDLNNSVQLQIFRYMFAVTVFSAKKIGAEDFVVPDATTNIPFRAAVFNLFRSRANLRLP